MFPSHLFHGPLDNEPPKACLQAGAGGPSGRSAPRASLAIQPGTLQPLNFYVSASEGAFLKAEEGGDAVASLTDDNAEEHGFRGADVNGSGVAGYHHAFPRCQVAFAA